MNRIYYRWSVLKPGAGTGINDRIVSGGYSKPNDRIGGGLIIPPKPLRSLSVAVSQSMAFNRRFQAAGQDARIEVFGQVFDTNNEADRLLSGLPDDGRPRPTNRVRELQLSGTPPLEEAREQNYARMDTPERDLLHVIALSNRDSTGGGALDASLDVAEDTEDVVAA